MTVVVRLPFPDAELRRVLAPAAAHFKVDLGFLVKWLAVAWELHRRGIPFKLGEIMRRDSSYQAKLYAQGRTTPGAIVTYAKPGESYHERGLAGHIEVDRKYREVLGEVVEAAGLTWGGRWTTKFPPLGDWQHMEDRS